MKFRVHTIATERHHYSKVIEATSAQDAEDIASEMDWTGWHEHNDAGSTENYIDWVEEVEDE